MDKRDFIIDLANRLNLNGNTMTGPDLALVLNTNGYQTSYGSPYEGGRGVYTLIQSIWNWLTSSGRPNDAQAVAEAFVTPDGEYAYDK